jgi:spore maturation protein CgeB
LGEMGIQRINYSTDDPWNHAHYAPWFLKALLLYDAVYTPREVNIAEFFNIGVKQVEYLPFAYDPRLHFVEYPATEKEQDEHQADIVFIGGADADRVPIIGALISEGFKVALYGGYWNRYKKTRAFNNGLADNRTMRLATQGAKIALCLVRRANRDGHVMRSFEIAAMGGCLLAEDTKEHRVIFGTEGNVAYYFKSNREMIEKAKMLINDSCLNKNLRKNVTQHIVARNNTYEDRLRRILNRLPG